MKIRLDGLLNFSLYIYIFLLHFEYWDFITGDLDNFSISKLSGIIYVILYFIRYKKIVFKKSLLLYFGLLTGFYILLVVVSVFNYNSYSDLANALNFNILQNIILFFILTNHLISNPGLVSGSLKAFALGGVCISILSLFNLGISYSETGRLQMFGEDPNYIGYRLVFAVITVVSIITNQKVVKNPRIYLWIPAIPFMLLIIVKTGSRGAITCLFLMILILIMITRSRRYIKPLIILFSVSLIILTIQWIKMNDVVYNRFLLMIHEGDTARRFMIWNKLTDLIVIHPFFGIGETGYIRETTRIFGNLYGAHNVYIEVLVKTGLAGFLLYFGFLFKILSDSYTALSRQKIILPMLFIFGIMFMFTNIQGIYNKSLYFFFAFTIVMSLNPEKEEETTVIPEVHVKKKFILFS
jgi:O-antigen ligase